jgi:hypothetical protein
MEQLKALIQKLMREGFYGRLTIHFKAGRVLQVDKFETLKME